LYQLFEKEAITTVNSKLADKELSVIVEVIDRPVLSDALSSNKKEK